MCRGDAAAAGAFGCVQIVGIPYKCFHSFGVQFSDALLVYIHTDQIVSEQVVQIFVERGSRLPLLHKAIIVTATSDVKDFVIGLQVVQNAVNAIHFFCG